jgi:hypothetical protein
MKRNLPEQTSNSFIFNACRVWNGMTNGNLGSIAVENPAGKHCLYLCSENCEV